MKIVSTILAIGIVLSLSGTTAFSSEDERYEEREYGRGHENREGYESKFYGTVEKIPEGVIGHWMVNGRDFLVTKDTRIKEKYGRAEVGAYVEIEGYYTGKTFFAHEIEVKRAKR